MRRYEKQKKSNRKGGGDNGWLGYSPGNGRRYQILETISDLATTHEK
jgi:hypothetical protein